MCDKLGYSDTALTRASKVYYSKGLFLCPCLSTSCLKLPLHRKCHWPGKLLASLYPHAEFYEKESYSAAKPCGRMSIIYTQTNYRALLRDSHDFPACCPLRSGKSLTPDSLSIASFLHFLRSFYAFRVWLPKYCVLGFCVSFTSTRETHIQAHCFFLVPHTFLVWYSPTYLINNTADSICRDRIQTSVHVGISDKNITLEDTSTFAPLSQEFTARVQCVLCD